MSFCIIILSYCNMIKNQLYSVQHDLRRPFQACVLRSLPCNCRRSGSVPGIVYHVQHCGALCALCALCAGHLVSWDCVQFRRSVLRSAAVCALRRDLIPLDSFGGCVLPICGGCDRSGLYAPYSAAVICGGYCVDGRRL